MDKQPLVSVIIPVYNGSKYLATTIDSVLSQTYKNIELILIDDKSTDNSVEVIRGYGDKVKLIEHEKNMGGPGPTKNTGIKAAKGEYCAFIDQDDLWLKEKLEKQVKLFNKHPDTVANFTDGFIYDDKNQKDLAQRWSKMEELPSQEYCVERLLKQNFILTTTAAMIKTSVLKENGGFDENMRLADDYEMWFRLAVKGKLAFIAEPLYKWRFHLTSLSHNEERHLSDLIYYFQKAEKAVGENKKYKDIIQENLSIFYRRLGNYFLHNKNDQEAFDNYKQSIKYDPSQNLLKVVMAIHRIFPSLARLIVLSKRNYIHKVAWMDPEWTLIDDKKMIN